MKHIRENKYFNLGMMLLAVIALSIVLLAVVLNLPAVTAAMKKVWAAFSPVISGLVLAYLLNPLMNFVDKRLYPALCRRKMKEQKAYKLSRAVSLLFAVIFGLILVYEFFSLLLPQLYTSVVGIVSNLNTTYAQAEAWVLGFLEDNPTLWEVADKFMGQFYDFLTEWFKMENIERFFTGITSSVMSVVSSVLDLLIGLVAAVYILWSRDQFQAQLKRITVALWRERTADHIFDMTRRIHKVFSGFIIGKLVDSLIIGLLCYIGMLIFRLPYPALVATVVGVTNVIPFFGPFIGAIPCAFLILLVNPMQSLYFILFIFGLQQLDGNIIGPRILGDTIGISSFWILVSITVAGGLFGFAGMLLGAPVFAVFYTLAEELITARLTRKGYDPDAGSYYALGHVAELRTEKTEEKTD